MTCKERAAEIVEYARRRAEPGAGLRAHLALCASCEERWEAERRLTSQFRVMRIHASARRPPEARRESLMREFARKQRRPAAPAWAWALSAAAVMLFAALLGYNVRSHARNTAPAIRSNGARTNQPIVYQASADASAVSGDDFIELPYAPPLAAGELIRVVHADLDPDELASMGIDIDPSWASELSADVVLGEDGLPRAFRIADNTQF
jgi:hypothetical protein